jgi:hypothetical protein
MGPPLLRIAGEIRINREGENGGNWIAAQANPRYAASQQQLGS